MLGSFLMLYCVLTLYGSALIYKDVEVDGCDPSGGVNNNVTCESSGSDVFGAMLGMYCRLLGGIVYTKVRYCKPNPSSRAHKYFLSVVEIRFLQVSPLRLKVSVNLATFRKPLRLLEWLCMML